MYPATSSHLAPPVAFCCALGKSVDKTWSRQVQIGDDIVSFPWSGPPLAGLFVWSIECFLMYKSFCACVCQSSVILVRDCTEKMPRERRRSTAQRPARRKKGTATTLSAVSRNKKLLLARSVVRWCSVLAMIAFPIMYSHLPRDCMHLSPHVLLFLFTGELSACLCMCASHAINGIESLVDTMYGRIVDML
jgi:hypothetical protein